MRVKKRLLQIVNRSLVLTGRTVSPRLAVGVGTRLNRYVKLDPQLNKRQLRENLRRYFPDRDDASIERIARDLQRNVLRARVFDKHFLPLLSTDEIDRTVETVNAGPIEAALASGRGCVVVSLHFGRFWALPLWFSRHGHAAMAVQASSGRLPAESATLSAGSVSANDPTVALRAVKALKKGAVLFLILDGGKIQNPVTVDFLDQPTRVSPAAFRIARTADALMVPVLVNIDPDDPEHIVARYEQPIDPREIPSGEPIATTMRRILEPLEAHVRAAPAQWYGFLNAHRRLARDDEDE